MIKYYLVCFIYIVFLFFFSEKIYSAPPILLKDIEYKKYQSEMKSSALASEINQLEIKIKTLTSAVSERRKTLSQRIQSYQFLKKQKLNLLFNFNDMSSFQRSSNNFQKINTYDVQYIQEQLLKIDELQNEKKRLVENFKKFKTLNDYIIQQNLLIQDLEKAEISELEQNEKTSLLRSKGQLVSPINSPIKNEFGLKKMKSSSSKSTTPFLEQYSLFNKGYTFLPVHESEKIQAIGPGKVIFSDVLQHWGESIIIQHEGNYYSIYAGLNKILVSQNQHLQAGETIGFAGNQSFYFELRHGTVPINPKEWIKDLK